jgi:hypothetical protein
MITSTTLTWAGNIGGAAQSVVDALPTDTGYEVSDLTEPTYPLAITTAATNPTPANAGATAYTSTITMTTASGP